MRIDVFHDTVCPWCRIGKAHLKQALSEWRGEAIDIIYHPFFLNPDIPEEGYDFRRYMTAKGGGRVPLEQWFAAPREMGQRAGLTFNFEAIQHAPNTLLSHQLIILAEDQEPLIDALYKAYFEDGQNIGDIDVLVQIGEQYGLINAREQLETGTGRDAVVAEVAQAQQLGITGVPFFIFENQFAFSGAQPPELFLQVMERATGSLHTQD